MYYMDLKNTRKRIILCKFFYTKYDSSFQIAPSRHNFEKFVRDEAIWKSESYSTSNKNTKNNYCLFYIWKKSYLFFVELCYLT